VSGRLPHQDFRGLLGVHCTLQPAGSRGHLCDPFHRRLQSIRYLHDCSDCYRLERKLPGGSVSHWVIAPFHGAHREIFHVAVTRHPTADWAAQQIVECCVWDRAPPRFLIHDRDSRYGANFDRRVRGLGIRQVRTPFRSPRAVAERWVRSVQSECLDHLIVFNEANLRRVLSTYVAYYNRWRPHRSLGQAVPCGEARPFPRPACRKIVAEPVLSGLHHIYRAAA
jgi:Integrase core domain